MVNGDDSTREFIVYRSSAHSPQHAPPVHKRAHSKHSAQGSSSMTSASMSARSSAVASSAAAAGSPHKDVGKMGRLRKLVSLRYYSRKVKGWFHCEDRDTIVCEDDEEEAATVFYGDDLLTANPKSVASAFYASWIEANASASKTTAAATSTVNVAPMCSPPLEGVGEYEPSKEQRWCTNCAKCFQRRLSRYDQFCGLDCRTAHRFRLAAS